MDRFVFRTSIGSSSLPVRSWKRRLKSSCVSCFVFSSNSGPVSCRNSFKSMDVLPLLWRPVQPMLKLAASDTLSSNGQLMRSQAERLFSDILRDPIHLIKNAARLDDGDPVLRVALPLTHSSFCRFLRNRLVGENSRPNLTTTLHTASDRNTSSLNLPAGDPTRLQCLEPELAKGNLTAPIGLASHAPFHHFTELNFFWC